jgi:hypothetical protein
MAPVKTGTGKEAGKRFSNTEWEALQQFLPMEREASSGK